MKILHVSCSPRGSASESHRLSLKIIQHLLLKHPSAQVIHRHLSDEAISHIDEDLAISMHSRSDRSQEGSAARSNALIHELDCSDIVVIGTPMHNFTVPSALKAWIDHVVRVRRTFNVTPQGKVGTLRDRPVFVAIASGGRFSGDHARQPDFLTPYLKAVFGIIGLHNLTFFSIQGTVLSEEVVAEARNKAHEAIAEYFSTYRFREPVNAPGGQARLQPDEKLGVVQ
jgi:FMN-dependent NADH-azoreductase